MRKIHDELKHQCLGEACFNWQQRALPLPHQFETTVNELAARLKVEYAIAAGFIKLLEKTGVAKIVGSKKKVLGAKGKPSSIYLLPKSVELKLAA